MTAPTALTDGQIQYALQQLPAWSVVDGKLHREFRCKNFVEAFGFMARVALLAEALNHHPEWSNVWNSVVIDLVTHEAGDAISQLDITLAQRIDALV
jgi:4a-hydroxytetrahydrobiopterin dehydratase